MPSVAAASLQYGFERLPGADQEGSADEGGGNPEFDRKCPVAPFGFAILHHADMAASKIVGKLLVRAARR